MQYDCEWSNQQRAKLRHERSDETQTNDCAMDNAMVNAEPTSMSEHQSFGRRRPARGAALYGIIYTKAGIKKEHTQILIVNTL